MNCQYFLNSKADTEFIDKNQCFLLDKLLPYGYGVLIGDYEDYPIYSLTNYQIHETLNVKNTWNPTNEYIRDVFYGMTESFPNFSHDFLLYYINLKKGLQHTLPVSLMTELRQVRNNQNL